MPIIVHAKSPPDAVQQKLRDAKKVWNRRVSAFISDVIDTKRTMNGSPSKFFREKSKIIEPIPADPGTLLGALLGDFNEIVNEGNSIIKAQIDYSQNRRKKIPHPSAQEPAQQPQQPAGEDLSKQLAAASNFPYALIANGSNPLTRFFTKLLNPTIGGNEAAKIKKFRMSMLDSVAEANRDLKKMQKEIVKSSPESIFIASKLLDKVESKWAFISAGFNAYQETHQEQPIQPPPPDADLLARLQEIISDVDKSGSLFSRIPSLIVLKKQVQQYKVSTDQEEKNALATQIFSGYPQALSELAALKKLPSIPSSIYAAFIMEHQQKEPQVNNLPALTQEIPAQEIAEEPQKTAAEMEIQRVAQNFLGKMKHRISPFDKTSSFRLSIHDEAKGVRRKLNTVMDLLQKGLEVEAIIANLKEATTGLVQIRSYMRALSSTIRGMDYHNEFTDMLGKGRIGEHDINFDPKQKGDFEKMLKMRQMRELANWYRKQ